VATLSDVTCSDDYIAWKVGPSGDIGTSAFAKYLADKNMGKTNRAKNVWSSGFYVWYQGECCWLLSIIGPVLVPAWLLDFVVCPHIAQACSKALQGSTLRKHLLLLFCRSKRKKIRYLGGGKHHEHHSYHDCPRLPQHM
jgi:hypothetical protein